MADMQDATIEFLTSKDGVPTVKVNDVLLHSKYDPRKEAKRLVEENYDENKINILFGFGLGYIYEQIKEMYDDDVIVIDPLYSELKKHAIIQAKYVAGEINNIVIKNVVYEQLKFYSRRINVICSPNYQRIFLNEYKEVLKILKTIQHSNIVSENTIRFYSEKWQENYIHNLSLINKFDSFNSLVGKFDLPIVIASGGPSLIKQIPLLKAKRDQCILIASGSTVNSLVKEDVFPDFIVSVDGGEPNYNHFKSLKIEKSRLLFSFSSHYKIQQEFNGDMYAFLLDDNLYFQKYLQNEFNINLPLMKGGTSVANFALGCAIQMTSGPIAIIGQDLAYTNNQSHAQGNKNYAELDKKLLVERGAFEEEGYNGDKVWTDSVFVTMREEFDKLYYIYGDDSTVYNCTEGGLKIKSIPQMPFKEFCNMYMQEDSQKYIPQMKNFSYEKSILIKKFKQEILRYESLKKELRDVLLALKIEKNQTYFSSKLLKKLDKIDEKIKKIQEKTSISYILEPVLLDAVTLPQFKKKDSEEEKFKKAYLQNEKLYNDVMLALDKTKNMVQKLIEKGDF